MLESSLGGKRTVPVGRYTCTWDQESKRHLAAVGTFAVEIPPQRMEAMVSAVLRKFAAMYDAEDREASGAAFDATFRQGLERSLREMAFGAGPSAPAPSASTTQTNARAHPRESATSSAPKERPGTSMPPAAPRAELERSDPSESSSGRETREEDAPMVMRKPERLLSKKKSSARPGKGGDAGPGQQPSQPKGKEARRWDTGKDEDIETLDLTTGSGKGAEEDGVMDVRQGQASQVRGGGVGRAILIDGGASGTQRN